MDIRDEVRSLVVDFLSEVCNVDRARVTDDSRLTDVDVDSLELVALVQELQRRYDVPLNDDRVIGVETVGGLVDLVVQRVDQQRTASVGRVTASRVTSED